MYVIHICFTVIRVPICKNCAFYNGEKVLFANRASADDLLLCSLVLRSLPSSCLSLSSSRRDGTTLTHDDKSRPWEGSCVLMMSSSSLLFLLSVGPSPRLTETDPEEVLSSVVRNAPPLHYQASFS